MTVGILVAYKCSRVHLSARTKTVSRDNECGLSLRPTNYIERTTNSEDSCPLGDFMCKYLVICSLSSPVRSNRSYLS